MAEIFGILNLTPDSFSGDGVYYDLEAAQSAADYHFQSGAHFVDIGAESTRPGATPIGADEEWRRLAPALEAVAGGNAASFSIDTIHPETVWRISSTIGQMIINDVTGMNNPAMREAVAECGVSVIVSHLDHASGTDIQKAHKDKPTKTVQKVVDELKFRSEQLVDLGLTPEQIILDPGWGFGKAAEIYKDLLEELPSLLPDFAFMLGISRKSSLKKRDFHGDDLLDFDSMTVEDRVAWLDQRSVEVALTGLAAGYRYFRVHNVAAHAKALLI